MKPVAFRSQAQAPRATAAAAQAHRLTAKQAQILRDTPSRPRRSADTNKESSTSDSQGKDSGSSAPSRRQLFQRSAAGALGGCLCGVCGPSPVHAATGGTWGYGPTKVVIEQAGPAAWGSICPLGEYQSPIDLTLGPKPKARNIREEPVKRVTTRYREAPRCTLANPGHGTPQVNFPPKACMTSIGSNVLELVQFHFHTPSEHTMNGKHFSMEAHLVHKDVDTGTFTVLAVMLQRGGLGEEHNPCLRKALDLAPDPGNKVTNSSTTFNPVHLLPDSFLEGRRSYVNYYGSLTTPPCTEGVNWYVFTDPVYVNDQDILDFIDFCGDGAPGYNSRPLRPLNDREYILYREGYA